MDGEATEDKVEVGDLEDPEAPITNANAGPSVNTNGCTNSFADYCCTHSCAYKRAVPCADRTAYICAYICVADAVAVAAAMSGGCGGRPHLGGGVELLLADPWCSLLQCRLH